MIPILLEGKTGPYGGDCWFRREAEAEAEAGLSLLFSDLSPIICGCALICTS